MGLDERIQTVAADMSGYAFPDGSFDLILCRYLVFTYFEISSQAGIAEALNEQQYCPTRAILLWV